MIFATLLIGAPAAWIVPAAVLAMLVIILTIINYARASASSGVRMLAAVLKVAGVVLLALCVIEPLFSGVRPRPGANLFVLLSDNSQSMSVRTGSRVRDDDLRHLLAEQSGWRTRLQQDFDVRNYVFARELQQLDADAQLSLDGKTSSLSTAVETIAARFRARPVAGLLLFSDGNSTERLRDLDIDFPIYPVVDADSDVVKDVRIQDLAVSQTNFEAAPVTVRATVATEGLTDQKITAQMLTEQGEVLAEDTSLPASGTPEFEFQYRPTDAGLSFQQLVVFPTSSAKQFKSQEPGQEFTIANNRRWIAVDRGGGPYRVLYVAGMPNWDFKFLRRALEEDHEIELGGLIRIAKKQPKFGFRDRSGVDDRNQLFEGFDGKDEEDVEAIDQPVLIRQNMAEDELRDGFPNDDDVLFDYHAIILDNLEAKFFSPDQMLLLRRFVSQRGGGLMMLGGADCFVDGGYEKTPVGEMLPVYLRKPKTPSLADEEPLRWMLTREGWLEHWTRLRPTEAAERARLDELPNLQVMNRVDGLKPGASLLAQMSRSEGKSLAALATQRFGKGRSAALLVGDLWRWGMHRRDPEDQDLPQIWRQMVRWLVADVPQRVELHTSPTTDGSGAVRIEVTVRDVEYLPHDNADVGLSITTPAGETIQLTPEAEGEAGTYAVDFWPKDEGPYRATAHVVMADGEELDPKMAGWASQQSADEFQQMTTDVETLKRIADQSGGQLVDVEDLDEFVASLPNRNVPVSETWVYPLWHQPWVLGLAIACLCGEWGLRRWRGLP